jgi:DNA mismatch repair ATPase MutS
VHPANPGAVGNDLALDAGLLVTGSNMSGKSTFLRTIAVNAICAQSIHTIAIAATHDLDVAEQVDARSRGCFGEPDDETGQFDRKLRPGIASTTNALAVLVRAGYPQTIVAAIERREGLDVGRTRSRPGASTMEEAEA